jgi:hypothetical protein
MLRSYISVQFAHKGMPKCITHHASFPAEYCALSSALFNRLWLCTSTVNMNNTYIHMRANDRVTAYVYTHSEWHDQNDDVDYLSKLYAS